jgi:hypothetical protein
MPRIRVPGQVVALRATSFYRARIFFSLVVLSIIAASSLLLRCSGSPTIAGGVETTNGLIVVSSGLTVRGSAPVGSVVTMFLKSYNPLAVTDLSSGFSEGVVMEPGGNTFTFTTMRDSGEYNVFARNPQTDSGAIVSALRIRAGCHDSVVVPFERLGEIRGSVVRVANGADTVGVMNQHVYCEGSNLTARTDSLGRYVISDVPLGSFKVKLMLYGPVTTSIKNNDNLAVLSRERSTAVVNLVIE